MFRKKILNKRGFTYLELIIVIAVTLILTTVFVVSTRQTPVDDVNTSTNKVISDIRYARSLATSKTVSRTNFPAGGYGIQFTDGADNYVIFGDENGNGSYDGAIIDTRVRLGSLDNSDLELEDANQTVAGIKYFMFKSENEVNTNFATSSEGLLTMAINYNPGIGLQGYKGLIYLGEVADDGSIFVNLGLGSTGYESSCVYEGDPCDANETCCFGQGTCTNSICTIPPENPPPANNSCFPAGTKILMADRTHKNIEDVVVGDHVLSYDEETGQQVSAEVLEVVSPFREHMCKVVFEDGTLQMTNEHPVFTSDGWKSINPDSTYSELEDFNVEQLDLGDMVYFSDGRYKEVMEINCWQEIIQTYNLKSVYKYSTFFADDVLVHNALRDNSCGVIDPTVKSGSSL